MSRKRIKESKIKSISWSELNLWETNPEEWERRYVEGIVPPPTLAMRFGTDAHSLIASDNRNEIYAQLEKRWTSGEMRILQKIVENWLVLFPVSGRHEVLLEGSLTHREESIPISGYIDFIPEGEDRFVENKIGAPWTKARAEGHGQLEFYALLYFLNNEKVLPATLVSFNSKNGNVQSYSVEPSIKPITERIIIFYEWLQKYDLCDKRISTKKI